MSNEATVYRGLRIVTAETPTPVIDYKQFGPQAYQATVTARNGPTPGVISVPSSGVNVNLSQLTAFGGLVSFWNESTTVTVYVGIKDAFTGKFYPLHQMLPNEGYATRLADILGQDYGTGTLAEGTDSLHLRAKTINGTATVANVVVEAFDP